MTKINALNDHGVFTQNTLVNPNEHCCCDEPLLGLSGLFVLKVHLKLERTS